ncbi:aromatic ring-hydroxylating dioxygenase subunit alpha [Sphingomonas sp. MG17]|uniref:Aromatic ring-hydroxylating dioxygenase subunit alpha n=1 Tax=Sphingomonas tagetis TaxID=2949092 RepID=A0A9X2HHM7_9SPHN|nr:aromatic ring-hydroxylating dioxygenase subunit alpha [Sphingomonas tagetis]MCP3731371.1 aromatic ring-hydroxylating dioxygenase subunit alpha [Sphingomonas tagetis]
MHWLTNCWYAAAWADEIKPRERLARRIIDQPILFWRDDAGRVRALANRCPHRLAPLSLGRIEGNVVQCGYHGLRFDGDTGRCVQNPHGPLLGALAVRPYPLVERHRLLWIWMGEPDLADDREIPDLSFADRAPEHAFSKGYMHTVADHRLLEDNILDLSHGDYLHVATLGGGSFTRATVQVEECGDKLHVRWVAQGEKAIPIWQPELPDPDALTDMTTEVLWYPSGVMFLGSELAVKDTPDAGLATWNAHIMTPETAVSTHYLYCNSRNYRVDDAAYNAAITAGLAIAFGGEDKPMIEAQQEQIGEADLLDCAPTLLSIDNASTRARRIYRRLVEAERAAIENPVGATA